MTSIPFSLNSVSSCLQLVLNRFRGVMKMTFSFVSALAFCMAPWKDLASESPGWIVDGDLGQHLIGALSLLRGIYYWRTTALGACHAHSVSLLKIQTSPQNRRLIPLLCFVFSAVGLSLTMSHSCAPRELPRTRETAAGPAGNWPCSSPDILGNVELFESKGNKSFANVNINDWEGLGAKREAENSWCLLSYFLAGNTTRLLWEWWRQNNSHIFNDCSYLCHLQLP